MSAAAGKMNIKPARHGQTFKSLTPSLLPDRRPRQIPSARTRKTSSAPQAPAKACKSPTPRGR
eukprot:2045927-Alexandrium_andersonii.AAC.1